MYTPCSRISLTVAMETMHFFIVQLSLSLRTKVLCISGVPGNDLTPMKNWGGGGGGIKLAPGVFKLWSLKRLSDVCTNERMTG